MEAVSVIGHSARQALNRQRRNIQRIGFVVLMGSAISLISWHGQSPARAEEVAATSPLAKTRALLLDTEQAPLDPNPREEIERNLAITEDTISETSLTPPSLWWRRDQITEAVGNSRFIETWVAYRGSEGQPRRVDVVVNSLIWDLLNYLERYAVLNQLGSVAKSYGYSTRIFRGSELTGAYICDFSQFPTLDAEIAAAFTLDTLAAIGCMIELDFRGRGSIRGNPSLDGS